MDYLNESAHDIIIEGHIITHLVCQDNHLTALDISNNTALYSLYCEQNQLSATGLNDLFRTLDGNVRGKTIAIEDNPGTSECDLSIVDAKGWSIAQIFQRRIW